MPFNKFVERDFPHIVEIIVPRPGKGGKLDDKRRAGVREVEKCFPYFVETDVPLGGFGNRLDAMYEFHTRHSVRAINSTGRRGENGRYYVRWCFADPALAEAFASEFGST
jgi:hypothetical protein